MGRVSLVWAPSARPVALGGAAPLRLQGRRSVVACVGATGRAVAARPFFRQSHTRERFPARCFRTCSQGEVAAFLNLALALRGGARTRLCTYFALGRRALPFRTCSFSFSKKKTKVIVGFLSCLKLRGSV